MVDFGLPFFVFGNSNFHIMEIDNLLIAQMCQLKLDIKFDREDEANRLQYEQKELIDDYFNFNF